jgi:deazaflavin-dependent oxidoreductase (nitroreductase family)
MKSAPDEPSPQCKRKTRRPRSRSPGCRTRHGLITLGHDHERVDQPIDRPWRASPVATFLRRIALATAGLGRPLAGRRWLKLYAQLYHTGRRSGRTYVTPIVACPTPGGFVVPVPFGNSTQWVRNVLAAGGAELRWNGQLHRLAAPVIVDLAATGEALSPVQRAIARRLGLDRYVAFRAEE